ncbi:hypothetical protein THAOC_23405 [Thalassiosira oceanica]|uniref:Uncharacterized protein n=1 Tax=Thalassiosira oceanica TaxID=159749 RepID=K0RUN5_THAOC|nr:hypothetical protein THAOC_23405 [Thalassiosira oceanica]|eukprot:EJK56665.1 hypothetical protein THAOC_23405 [Thalassiosira oceanica]
MNESNSHKQYSQFDDLNHSQSSNQPVIAKLECPLEDPQTGFKEEPEPVGEEPFESNGRHDSTEETISKSVTYLEQNLVKREEGPEFTTIEEEETQTWRPNSKQDHDRIMYHGNLNVLATEGLATEHSSNYDEDAPMEVKQLMAPYWEKNMSGIQFRQI